MYFNFGKIILGNKIKVLEETIASVIKKKQQLIRLNVNCINNHDPGEACNRLNYIYIFLYFPLASKRRKAKDVAGGEWKMEGK